jgi:hypothetical protein
MTFWNPVKLNLLPILLNEFSEEFFSGFPFPIKNHDNLIVLIILVENGIYVPATWNVFDSLIGKDYTKQEMEALRDSTMEGIEEMADLIEVDADGSLGLKQSDVDAMKSIVANKAEIEKEIAKRL